MGIGGAMVAGDLIQGAMDVGGQLIVNHENQKHSAEAYQRTVADLTKAGLNPMLAYSQGPTTNAVMSSDGFTKGAEAIGRATTASTVGKTQYADMAAAMSNAKLVSAQATSAGVAAEASKDSVQLDLEQKRANIVQTIANSDLTTVQKDSLLAQLPGLKDLQTAQTEAARGSGQSATATAARTRAMQTEADAQQKAWKELDSLADGNGGAMAKMVTLIKLLLSRSTQ